MIVKDIPVRYDGAFSQKKSTVLVPGDVSSYRIVYTTPFDLSGALLSVVAIKENGSAITDVGTVDQNTGYYVLKNSMYDTPGFVSIRLTLNGPTGEILTAKELVFDVADSVYTDISADDRVPALNSLISQTAVAIGNAEQSASAANSAAEDAAEAAEDAVQAAGTVEEVVGRAETAIENANNAADAATDAAENVMVSIAVDSTITGAAGTEALVENVGTTKDARLKFTIPQGAKGERGERGYSGVTSPVNGFFSVYVNEEGHLIVVAADDADAPPLSIVDGHLIYTI